MATATIYMSGASRADRTAKVQRLRRLAWLIDAAAKVPGTRFRFGLNSLIGLTPGAGDAALVLISLYIVYEAKKLRVPQHVIQRMIGNVVVEALLGAVPILGDLMDVAYKANLRNIAILEDYLANGG